MQSTPSRGEDPRNTDVQLQVGPVDHRREQAHRVHRLLLADTGEDNPRRGMRCRDRVAIGVPPVEAARAREFNQRQRRRDRRLPPPLRPTQLATAIHPPATVIDRVPGSHKPCLLIRWHQDVTSVRAIRLP